MMWETCKRCMKQGCQPEKKLLPWPKNMKYFFILLQILLHRLQIQSFKIIVRSPLWGMQWGLVSLQSTIKVVACKKNTNKSLILSKIYAGFLTYWISAAVAFFSAASVVASLTEHCFHWSAYNNDNYASILL